MLTAVEVGARRLTAVTVKVNGRGPEIVRGGSAELAGLDAAGVKAALAACGVEGPKGILVVPRGQALLRDLELPDGTPDELVAMVRFQVERELPLPLDQVRFSFIETSRAAGKVRIQVAAVPRETIDPALAAVEAAGLKVSGAYVSSFGLLSLHQGEGPAALVEVGGGEAEILVADEGRVEFSRTAAFEADASAESLAEEVQRSLLSYGARAPGREIRRILLAGEGEEAAKLAAAMRERLVRDVAQAGPGDLDTAPIAGLCAGLLAGRPMPDLLHPPEVRGRFRPTRKHRIGAAVGGALLLLFLVTQIALASRRGALETKRKDLEALRPRVAAASRAREQTRLAGQWSFSRSAGLELLGALKQSINPADLWITNAVFDDAGEVRLQGKARDDKHVTELVSALKKSERFADVHIGTINPSDRGEYRQDFTLTARLAGSDPKKKK
jgi:uncharacterized protein YciU (UPF0263 family)